MISNVSTGTWVVVGVGCGVAGVSPVLRLKSSSLDFGPGVDDHSDREFRAMIEETGEDPGVPEDDAEEPRRAPLNENDIFEDLTGGRET